MHDLLVVALRHLRGVWRFRWWTLGIAWLVCLVGWIVVARLPDVYEASAKIYIDTESVLQPHLRGLATQAGNVQNRIQLMTRTLFVRPNLVKVMRMTDLDLRVTTPDEREELVKQLRENIVLAGTARENLYTINYTDSSPELAKLVVKSVLAIMESQLGKVRNDQNSATRFLEQQIADYERRMVQAEERLTRFKQQNLGYLPNEAGGYYAKLREVQQQGKQAELQLLIAQDRVKLLRQQIEGETPSFGVGPSAPSLAEGGPELGPNIDTSSFDKRIEALKIQLDQMLVRYTDRHPDVVATRKAVEDLEAERKRFVDDQNQAYRERLAAEAGVDLSEATAEAGYNLAENPVYQQLRLQLTNAEATTAAKKIILADLQKQAQELETGIDKVLQTEAEMKQLSRDYAILKSSHDKLQARLESARIGSKADSRSDSVQFRVIDPPFVPPTPSGPNRILLSTAVLIGGLIIGFLMSLLMSQFRPTFDERQVMSEILGLPVLGSVNMVWTSSQIRARKMRNVSFVFTFTALVLLFGVVLALYQLKVDLLPRLAEVLKFA